MTNRVVIFRGPYNIYLKTYFKLDGKLRREDTIHFPSRSHLEFLSVYGNNRILVQQYRLGMQLIEISGDIHDTIQTNIDLDKLDGLLCWKASLL